MNLGGLVAFIGVAMAGALGHELAHWGVWKLTGRDPRLDWWALTVQPRAGPGHTTPGDRLAAAAPYCVGASAVVSGVVHGHVLWVVFGVAMFQVPSRSDVAAMRGTAAWRGRQSSASERSRASTPVDPSDR